MPSTGEADNVVGRWIEVFLMLDELAERRELDHEADIKGCGQGQQILQGRPCLKTLDRFQPLQRHLGPLREVFQGPPSCPSQGLKTMRDVYIDLRFGVSFSVLLDVEL